MSHAATTIGLAILTAGVVCGCSKKESDPQPVASAQPAATGAATVAAGDGGSMASPLALAMGKTVEGALGCAGAPWFLVAPPAEAQVVYELQVPQGEPQLCTHLNARDGAGKLLDSTVSLCSDNPAAFARGQASFGKDVRFFTIDKADPNAPCSHARYRVALAK